MILSGSCILTFWVAFKLHVILHLHDHFFIFVLIPLATVRVWVPCRLALLPICIAHSHGMFDS